MAIALVAHVAAGSTAGAPITTGSIDTSGASLLVAAAGDYQVTGASVITDSKSNTWLTRTAYVFGGGPRIRLSYVVAPTVGSGHTFTATPTGTGYPSIAVAAFSGVRTTSPYNTENGNNSTPVMSFQAGAITPAENNALVIATIASNTLTTLGINLGFSITDQVAFGVGSHFGVGLAYLVQGTAASVNPTWTLTNSAAVAATIASFLAAAAATGSPWYAHQHYQHVGRS